MGNCATKSIPVDGPITSDARRVMKPESIEHETKEGGNEQEPLVAEAEVVPGETSKGEESAAPLMVKPKEEEEKNDEGNNAAVDGKEEIDGLKKTEAVPDDEKTPSPQPSKTTSA